MKKEIHPEYFTDATITCACGETYNIGSTNQKMQTELCANCHPFYTGKQKIIDTARRVEKFEKRLEAQKEKPVGKKTKAAKRRARKIAKREEQEKSDLHIGT